MSAELICPRSGSVCEAASYCASVKEQIREDGVPSNYRSTMQISPIVAQAGAISFCVDTRIRQVGRIADRQAQSEMIDMNASYAALYVAQLRLLQKFFSTTQESKPINDQDEALT